MASQLTKPDKSTLSKCGSPEPRTRTDQARRNCLFLTNRRSVSLTSIPSGTHLGAIHLSNTHIALEDHSALRDHVTLCPPPSPLFPSPLPAGTTYCRFRRDTGVGAFPPPLRCTSVDLRLRPATASRRGGGWGGSEFSFFCGHVIALSHASTR